MGLLSSSSKSTTNVDESVTNYNEFDQRQFTDIYNEAEVGAGAIRTEGDVNVLDGGSIEQAFGFASSTSDGAFEIAESVIGAVTDSQEKSLELVALAYGDSLGTVERLSESENQSTSKSIEKMGLMLVGGLVLVFGITAWGKK